jgi:hypothetical protein
MESGEDQHEAVFPPPIFFNPLNLLKGQHGAVLSEFSPWQPIPSVSQSAQPGAGRVVVDGSRSTQIGFDASQHVRLAQRRLTEAERRSRLHRLGLRVFVVAH